MSKFDQKTRKSVRVVLPLTLYNAVKDRCGDYGDLSRLVRHLLKEWIRTKGTIRAVYESEYVEPAKTHNSDADLAACVPLDAIQETGRDEE